MADGRSRGNLIHRAGWCLPPLSPSWRRAGVDSLARSFLLSLGSEDRAEGTLFVPPVANLKTARTLALDDDFAVLRAQFDLANVTAHSFCAR